MGMSAYRRSVELATEILGGHEAVAKYLGTTPDMVASWAAGSSEPAVNFLLRLVELIEQKTVAAARAATVVRRRKDEGA
jgi:DNA-binding transcriptional regulator YiaG